MDEQLSADERTRRRGSSSRLGHAGDRGEAVKAEALAEDRGIRDEITVGRVQPSRRAAMSAVSVSGTASRRGRRPADRRLRRARAGPVRAASGRSPPRTAARRPRAPRCWPRHAAGSPGTRPASRRSISGGRQRLEVDRGEVALARAPVRAPLEQLRPCERDDRDGHVAAPVQQVVDEVEQALVGLVEVLEHHAPRARSRRAARRTCARRRTAGPTRSGRPRPAAPGARARSRRRSAGSGTCSATVSPIRARVVASSSASTRPHGRGPSRPAPRT